MKLRTGLWLLALMAVFPHAHSPGVAADDAEASRGEKLRLILRIQDLRTVHDTGLTRLLYDPDTLVRERAVLACGSIQDTAVLPDLLNNLTDAPAPVQAAAAFAIGQTASMLGPSALAGFGHEIIWVRLDRTRARGRMIEELGKFGTEQALTDLMLRFGAAPGRDRGALLMSVARFAIRKVTTPEAVRFAVRALLDEGRDAWIAAYALQRIGANPETYREAARLVPVTRNADPLVRMNLATLFGKLMADSSMVEPLIEMADFGSDWRVRVNALKALGNFPAEDRILGSLRLAFTADNPSIALTALSVLGGVPPSAGAGSSMLTAVTDEVKNMALNSDRDYPWQYQVEAAKALARMLGEAALETLGVPDEPGRLLRAGMIEALGATASVKAEAEISSCLDDVDPLLRRASLEALHLIAGRHRDNAALRERAFSADVAALSGGDMAVTTTAAANLGDSLFTGLNPVPALIAALGTLRPPADIEPIQEVCRTLSKSGDRAAVPALLDLMDGGDAAAAAAAAGALGAITGEDYISRIPRDREPLHTDFDFEYLDALPDTIPVSIETTRGEIRIELYRDAAPFTIMSVLKLAGREGFYRGLIFHRVVPNFVIQGGDPRGDGWGGPGYSLRSEFSPLSYTAGTVGIASAGKDTEGSQFFITHSPQPHLDGRYTIIGRVVSGMETVDEIRVGDRMYDVVRIR